MRIMRTVIEMNKAQAQKLALEMKDEMGKLYAQAGEATINSLFCAMIKPKAQELDAAARELFN
jgi:hypothetical protein